MKKLLSIVIITTLAGCSSMGMSGSSSMSGASNMSRDSDFSSQRYPNVNAPFDANDPYHGG